MIWINGTIIFPSRLKKFIILTRYLARCGLVWDGDVGEENYIRFLESLFMVMKDKGMIPKDSQLHMAGHSEEEPAIFLIVSSDAFDVLPSVSHYPKVHISEKSIKEIVGKGIFKLAKKKKKRGSDSIKKGGI